MIQNFYILGMGRSGTTLFQSILDAHSAIVVPPESYFVLHLYSKYFHVKKWDTNIKKKFIEDLYTDRPFRLVWRVPKENLLEAFNEAPTILNLGEALNIVRSSFRDSYKQKEIIRFGGKKPIYSMFTKRIMKVNPNAKIIHIVRDPRGTANGQINTFKKKDALAIGYMWNWNNKTILKLKKKYPNQYFLLRYEDLIENTETTMKAVCHFLEVPYESSLMEYRTTTTKRFTEYTEEYKNKHRSLLKPIDKSIAEKWKKTLQTKHRKEIEYVTSDLAKQFGYHFKKPKSDLWTFLRMPVSKFKMIFGVNIIRMYFSIPFFVRKFILGIRSRLTDHKYWPEQPKA